MPKPLTNTPPDWLTWFAQNFNPANCGKDELANDPDPAYKVPTVSSVGPDVLDVELAAGAAEPQAAATMPSIPSPSKSFAGVAEDADEKRRKDSLPLFDFSINFPLVSTPISPQLEPPRTIGSNELYTRYSVNVSYFTNIVATVRQVHSQKN